MSKNTETGKGSIVIYKAKGGKAELEVKLEKETVWLAQAQMAQLFGKDVRTVSEHIQNVFKEGELQKNSTIRNFRIVQTEGGRQVQRSVDFYNLDIIISVGYRVKSMEGTQFRIWATNLLKSYLVKGYALNERKLLEQGVKLKELQETIGFINSKASHPELKGQERELLNIVNEYSDSLTLLYQYDNELLEIRGVKQPTFELSYDGAREFVHQVKEKLAERGSLSDRRRESGESALSGDKRPSLWRREQTQRLTAVHLLP